MKNCGKLTWFLLTHIEINNGVQKEGIYRTTFKHTCTFNILNGMDIPPQIVEGRAH